VSGNLSRYDDGRRDLQLSIEEHFLEQVETFNRVVLACCGRKGKAPSQQEWVFNLRQGLFAPLTYLS
jgi:hypothetical protein